MRTVDGVEILTEVEKQALIVATIRQRGLRCFVETGTYKGDTLAAVMPYVNEAFSIEAWESSFLACSARFSGEDVPPRLLFGDSATMLPAVLEHVHEPALIWLDAHHSDADSAGTHDTCPLRAELHAIFDSPTADHVVFCDDARFLGRGNWPTLDEIKMIVAGHPGPQMRSWDVVLKDDIVRIARPGVLT